MMDARYVKKTTESVIHVLRDCIFAHLVWEANESDYDMEGEYKSFLYFVEVMFEKLPNDSYGMFMTLCCMV